MKLKIPKDKLDITPEQFLRRAGYVFIQDKRGKESFVRRLGRNFYPRFHIYIEAEEDFIVFSLHLDQKRPIYSGAHAHNAEYDGEVVEAEIERLRSLVGNNF